MNRVRVEPGKLPTPPHSHGASEESYFVLAGSGLASQDGAVHDLRPKDCVIYRADELEHTFIAGPDGLEYLVFGTRHATEIGWLPRSRAIRFGWPWIEGRYDYRGCRSCGRAARVRRAGSRPANILNVDEVELEHWEERLTSAPLATTSGSVLAGLHWEQLAPGRRGSAPHCHSEEEEVFVVLEGARRSSCGVAAARATGARTEEIALRPGHLVARPPGTEDLACVHCGWEGVTMLVYGTRRPNDMAWFPRSNKIYWRGLGVIGRIEALDYFDGEPED